MAATTKATCTRCNCNGITYTVTGSESQLEAMFEQLTGTYEGRRVKHAELNLSCKANNFAATTLTITVVA